MARDERGTEAHQREGCLVATRHEHGGNKTSDLVAVCASGADHLGRLLDVLDVMRVTHVPNVFAHPMVDGERFTGVITWHHVSADIFYQRPHSDLALVRELPHPFHHVFKPWVRDELLLERSVEHSRRAEDGATKMWHIAEIPRR